MAAGGFREFIPGEILDEEKINDFLMQGVLVFADATARDAAITAPVEGQFVFLKDTDVTQFFDGTDFVVLESGPPEFDFLVIAGGGSGGSSAHSSGGGGAGGYRNSDGTSGGLAAAENFVFLIKETNHLVTVGAGGAGGTSTSSNGSNSDFASIVSNGGDRGGAVPLTLSPNVGGSGAGAIGFDINRTGGNGSPRQGFNGGNGVGSVVSGDVTAGGGGGGAGAVGANGTSVAGGNGGAGLASTITGSSVTRGGGGGGGKRNTGSAGSGGIGGGGNGGLTAAGSNGIVNTGGGGGGAGGLDPTVRIGGNGGSGIVIIKYPDTLTLTIGGGLTSSTATAGGFKTTTFTAGTDVISF